MLDMQMPVMTGLDALHGIRLLDPHARVAMLTGEKHQETVLAAMAAGAVDFVGKPCKSDRVAETAAGLLSE